MAIKKRPAVDPAAIERFGDAADAPPAPAAQAATTATTPLAVAKSAGRAAGTAKRPVESAGEWPSGLGRTLLVRWPDPALAKELAEVAALEDRSQHKTALRALQRGLEALRADHQSER
ncbi:hypothetical protein C5C10_14555 [Rathayibacter sp. AY1A3]|nr:hypothetical protein C5C10_14555 [Rathayibacter sp. AY1A3]